MKKKIKTKKNYKLIIFDFDGTLADSIPGIYKTANIMAKKYGMSSIPMNKIKNAVGMGIEIFLNEIFKNIIDKHKFTAIKKDYETTYEKNSADGTRLFPGVRQTLKILKQKKIKMVILSNKKSYFIKKLCKYFNIDKFFIEIIGRGDLKKDKPDPYAINYFSKKYKINRKNILLVGDSQYDAECAANSKIDFFYLDYGYGDKKKTKKFKPAYIRKKFSDILNIID
ncbi:MAG: HAD family hydrolase [Candidatus Goldbacteria bacterium]|nr:HAD family hydrolase [Candidatus Goldiibacteriota bacterium]